MSTFFSSGFNMIKVFSAPDLRTGYRSLFDEFSLPIYFSFQRHNSNSRKRPVEVFVFHIETSKLAPVALFRVVALKLAPVALFRVRSINR
jgi:hypothetical protein